jgi:hypothetical protein
VYVTPLEGLELSVTLDDAQVMDPEGVITGIVAIVFAVTPIVKVVLHMEVVF